METYNQLVASKDENTSKALFAHLLEIAKQGEVRAIFCIGSCFDEGIYVDQDSAEAFIWFKQAAELGCLDAQYKLGCLYIQGQGTPRNEAEAIMWFTKAAEQEHLGAMLNLAITLQESTDASIKNSPKALEWFSKGARLGDKSAASRMEDLALKLYDISTKERVVFVRGVEIEDLSSAVAKVFTGVEEGLMQYLKPLWIAEYGKAIHVATKEKKPLSLSILCDCISTSQEFLFLVDVAIFEDNRMD